MIAARINHLGTLIFSTQRIVEQLRKQLARAKGPTIVLTVDELRSIADRLEELTAPARELRSAMVIRRNIRQELNAVHADPIITSAFGEPVE